MYNAFSHRNVNWVRCKKLPSTSLVTLQNLIAQCHFWGPNNGAPVPRLLNCGIVFDRKRCSSSVDGLLCRIWSFCGSKAMGVRGIPNIWVVVS